MALSDNLQRQTTTRRQLAPRVATASTVYAGGYTCLGYVDHATAAKRGTAFAWSRAINQIPLGWNAQPRTGDGTKNPASGLAPINVDGQVVQKVAVTGVAAESDIGRWVFMSDDTTLTLTRVAPDLPVGIIVDWYSSTTCDVYFLSFGELCALMAAGGMHRTWGLGPIAAVGGAGNILTGVVAPCHGILTAVYAICIRANTDADVSYSVNFEIGGTDVTGGVITLAAADTVGLKKSGTAITALATFHEGDLIDVEAAVGTAGTATDVGTYALFAEYDILPGL